MESKVEKHAHMLGRAKGELQGHRKMGTSKEHSLPGEGRGWDGSENGKQTSQQGTLTYWRGQRLGLVRTWKANKLASDTHSLERVEVGIGQNMESKQASKGHSQTGEGRHWDWRAQESQIGQEGRFTWWRDQKKKLVRT